MEKADGVPEEIRRVLKNVPGIQYAFIHSSSVKNMENHGSEVDIKIMLIGDEEEMKTSLSTPA